MQVTLVEGMLSLHYAVLHSLPAVPQGQGGAGGDRFPG